MTSVKPFIEKLINTKDDGRININKEDLKNIPIGDILGTIEYSVTGIGGSSVTVLGGMTWTSNDIGYNLEYFNSVRVAIITYYNVSIENESQLEESYSKFINDFFTIECNISENGTISITWEYNKEKYLKEKVATQITIEDLKSRLKNPESLQIHEVKYTINAYCYECDGAIGICIDYSAQNGFGGYNRDYYCKFVDTNSIQYKTVETDIKPDNKIMSSTLHKVNYNDNVIKEEYLNSTDTKLVVFEQIKNSKLESILDEKLINYLQYLKMPLKDTGFRLSQASKLGEHSYQIKLGSVDFMGCGGVAYLYYNTDTDISYNDIATNIRIENDLFSIDDIYNEIKTRIKEVYGTESTTDDCETYALTGTEYDITLYWDEVRLSLHNDN